MADKFINLSGGIPAIKTWVLDKLTSKQDTLVSGTSIKTMNTKSLLGSGDIEIPYVIPYGQAQCAYIKELLIAGYTLIIKNVPYNNEYITAIVNSWKDTGNAVKMDCVVTYDGDLWDVYVSVSYENVWNVTLVSRDPFMLYDFQQTLSNLSIPYCTEDIVNTSIPNVDVSISEAMGVNWAIASLAKYEVTDSNGKRINCWPVCQFSMNTQKTLRLRMMCAGTSRQTAVKIAGAILLKHR